MRLIPRFVLGLAGAVALALPAAAQTKWNLPAAYPADNFHTENLTQFAKDVSDATGGKKSVNFVMQISAEAQNTPITLTLTNIPFTEALRYVTELVGAKVEYQKFAVVIKPAGGAAPVVTSDAKSGTDSQPPQ